MIRRLPDSLLYLLHHHHHFPHCITLASDFLLDHYPDNITIPVITPLPVSSPPPASPIIPLGYQAAMIRLKAEAPSTSHSLALPLPIILSYTRSDVPSSGTPPLLLIPLPTSSPPLHLLSTDVSRQTEVTLPPRRGWTMSFVANMDIEDMAARPLRQRDVGLWDHRTLGMRFWQDNQDTYEIYTRLDDEQTERQLMAGRLNMLYRDRRAHARTTRLMEAEAKMSRESWG
ncbi:hypothetical protein Tco_0382308 [Tanacetum coccineum]